MRSILGVSLGLAIVIAGALTFQVSAQREARTVVVTSSGYEVEEVLVGRSCVVLVSRKGSGNGNYLVGDPLAVPCTR